MTVDELIDHLRTMPHDAPILVPSIVDTYKPPNMVERVLVQQLPNCNLFKIDDNGIEAVILHRVYNPSEWR